MCLVGLEGFFKPTQPRWIEKFPFQPTHHMYRNQPNPHGLGQWVIHTCLMP